MKRQYLHCLRWLSLKRLKWPLFSVLILGTAFALDYQVDPSGGPDTLRERIAKAAARWTDVPGGVVDLKEVTGAPNRIAYGDSTRFGPDTFSLTVQTSPNPATEVLLNPAEPSDRALTHELGLLAGLSPKPGVRGVMNPALPPESNAALSPADEDALRALAAFVPEDINQDGVVDFYDLADFGAAFGETGVSLPADIDKNGVVNRADLSLLEAAYTFGAPAETAPEDALAGASLGSGGTGSGSAASGGSASGGSVSGGTVSGGAASGGAN